MTRVREFRERCDGRVPYALYSPGQSYPCGKTIVAATEESLDVMLKACSWEKTSRGTLCGDCVHHGRTLELLPGDMKTP